MTTGRNWTAILGLALILTVAVIAVLLIGMATAPPAQVKAKPVKRPPAVTWYYGRHTLAQTNQKNGVVVDCVEKTNSVKFGNREYAKPGDVYIMTCTAEKLP